MSSLNIVLKTVERCNLNCSYCYFFNGLDQTYLKRPKFIKKETIDYLAKFLKEGSDSLEIKKIDIIFHGGEPLMQPKEDFIYLIEKLKSALSNLDLSFVVQTNGTLITKKWIELLNKYKVGVGVSIDGPPEYHDKYRIDHNENPSYDNVLRGITLLKDNLFSIPSCLTVVNPEFEGKKVYRHLVNLGFKRLDFLFPDNNYDNLPTGHIDQYAEYFIGIFDEWMKDNNVEISIRKLKSIMLQLLGKSSLVYGFGKSRNENNIPIIAIRSDGDVSPSDELISTDPKSVIFINKNVRNSTLKEILSEEIFQELDQAMKIIPEKCSKCCWYNACGSGSLVTRFSNENRFNNHSIYCDALQEILAHISSYLIRQGVPKEQITNNLFNVQNESN